MKLLIILSLISFDAFSVEYKSKLVCKSGDCFKKAQHTGLKEPELKLTDIAGSIGRCLLDVESEKISKIESVDIKTTKVSVLSEIEDHTLSREPIYFNSKLFNRNQKIIPCSEVEGIIGDEEQFQKCIQANGKSVRMLFCEKERIKNF